MLAILEDIGTDDGVKNIIFVSLRPMAGNTKIRRVEAQQMENLSD